VFTINADGTLSHEYEVSFASDEFRSGASIDLDDAHRVNQLAAEAREAAEIFLART
jgi:hypothetical protein